MTIDSISVRPPIAASRVARSGEVLDRVRRGQATTTSQLAEALGMARSTVNDRIAGLISSGLLISAEAEGGGRGRPATHLAFNPSAGATLAAQLGVSGVRVAVTDLAGEILASEMIDLGIEEGPEAILDSVVEGFVRLLEAVALDASTVHGIGFGMPTPVEMAGPAGGGAGWNPHLVSSRLRSWLDVPVHVDHDVNLLAFGERCVRAADTESLLCVKVGTVIGCGVVVNGQIIRGANELAGEIGHNPVPGSEVPCACGKVGCLSAVASGAAIARDLRGLGLDVPSARAVAELARAGDPRASRALRVAGVQIGEVLSSAVNLLNPGVITLWGYLADGGDQLVAGIQEAIAARCQPGPAAGVRVEAASMGVDAGLFGAAMAVAEQALEPAAVDAYLLARSEG